MKRIRFFCIFLFLSFVVVPLVAAAADPSPADGIPGATDKTLAATLIVPFFEVGINSETEPIDTLLVVTNVKTSQKKFHYHVWDVHGTAMDLYSDVDVDGSATWSMSMRTLIEGATSAVQTGLTDGNFYRGFVTIDVVTAETTKNPTESGYPFATGSSSNSLEGFIYYVRLSEGSSNSMDMLPINWVGSSVDSRLAGFYGSSSSDDLEKIDVSARKCSAVLASEAGSCSDTDTISEVDSRVFLNPDFNATTRIILFAWDPNVLGGPSTYCDTHACSSTFPYLQFDEEGSTVVDDTIRLDDVVNVIPVGGITATNINGWVSIRDIPDPETNRQVYAFSITNAKPPSGASANWDAILESFIIP